jgi:predicted nucleotidyltransferase
MAKARTKTEKPLPQTSSVPHVFPKKQHALFQEVLVLLQENKVPFAVSGAFALKHHTGICRDTKDLDLFLCAKDASRALLCLQQHGFKTVISDPVWLAKAQRDSYFVDLITGMSNGVITVDPSWISRAHPAEIAGVQTRVLGAEELLASKLFVTRRERFDGADIAHIIYGTRGKLNWKRIFHMVGEHWEILLWALVLFRYVYPAHSNYVPGRIWRDLIGRFSNAVSDRNPTASFRGSLIDELMFAIDVKEWGMRDLLAECRMRAPKIAVEALAPCA